MKLLIIKQVANGWVIDLSDNLYHRSLYETSNTTHVFQTIPQLQEALPGLLGESEDNKMAALISKKSIEMFKADHATKLTSDECLESHKKAVEEFERSQDKNPPVNP